MSAPEAPKPAPAAFGRPLLIRLLGSILKLCFRVQVRGLENLPAAGEAGVIVCNHVSRIDALLLLALLPGDLHFLLPGSEAWLPGWLARSSRLGFGSDQQLREAVRSLKGEGGRVVIFPETGPSPSGRIARIDSQAATVADRLAGSRYIPVGIAGAEIGRFAANGWRIGRWLPRITVSVCKPRRQPPPSGLKGAYKHRWQEMLLHRLLEEALFSAYDTDSTLPELMAGSARHFGAGHCVFSEVGPPSRRLSYRGLLRACFALGGEMVRRHPAGERVGLLLPTSVGAAAVFHAVQFASVVPAMLNFSASSRDVLSACRTARIGTVYTSQRFLDRHEASRRHADELAGKGIKVVLLEDVRASLKVSDKLRALFHSLMPSASLLSASYRTCRPDDPAVVLFTSGSEGDPKGVVLSHRNLVANARQVMVRLAAGPGDVLFNALPLFHSTGLLTGAVLPLAAAFEAVQYPSPLHYSTIVRLLLSTRATILLSTSTFLGQYARTAHANDMQMLRQVYAGGEKLRPAVSELWLEKFGRRVHEGYGVTETAPALAVDSPWTWEPGSVGTLLPGIEAALEPVPGIEEGGRLRVKGPNVMLGLLTGDSDEVQPPAGGWHDTGDIATIDRFGFLRIVGRARRFAKIAGEMVPLSRIEDILDELFVDSEFAVVAVADAERGERLVLVTSSSDVDIEQVRECIKKAGASQLWIPGQLQTVKEFPLLGSGKPNLPAVARLAGKSGKRAGRRGG